MKKIKTRAACAVIVILLLPMFVLAAEKPSERAYKEWLNKNWMTKHVKDSESLIRFELFAHCQPIRTKISSFDAYEGRSLPDFRKKEVKEIVTNKLQHHDLVYEISSRPKSKYAPELEVEIQLNGPVFAITMKLNKFIFEPSSNYIGVGPTWIRTFASEHQGRSILVLGAVSLILDKFLDKYREANRSCMKKNETMFKSKQ